MRAVERNVSRIAEAAADWLSIRGWGVQSDLRTLQLFGDEITNGDFTIRRFWLTPATLIRRSAPNTAGIVEATLVIEGLGSTADSESGVAPFEVGALLLSEPSEPLALTLAEPTALIQIETRAARIPAPLSLHRVLHHAEELNGARSVLASIVTALLNSTIEPQAAEFPYFEASLEAALAAVILEADTEVAHPGSPSERALFRRATTLIGTRFADPTFSLDTIASQLGVSKPYLQRVFRVAGTTPLQSLQRARAQRAEQLLATQPRGGRDDFEKIARQSGFPNARTMRDVLRRLKNPPQ
ncbi:helix-turn-helix transcriptional regulator [Microbacteriaceae bacterium VKM Ac-2854]|nr:helix-turn-helix transcriptional regulator [Microbacteriaceae bacterium VKM Ac-2854]